MIVVIARAVDATFRAELDGLISYSPNVVDEYRRAASYADRILKGAKPSELPVQLAEADMCP
jgi:ABC-type uncharacterized transport system substrate-binding protein